MLIILFSNQALHGTMLEKSVMRPLIMGLLQFAFHLALSNKQRNTLKIRNLRSLQLLVSHSDISSLTQRYLKLSKRLMMEQTRLIW